MGLSLDSTTHKPSLHPFVCSRLTPLPPPPTVRKRSLIHRPRPSLLGRARAPRVLRVASSSILSARRHSPRMYSPHPVMPNPLGDSSCSGLAAWVEGGCAGCTGRAYGGRGKCKAHGDSGPTACERSKTFHVDARHLLHAIDCSRTEAYRSSISYDSAASRVGALTLEGVGRTLLTAALIRSERALVKFLPRVINALRRAFLPLQHVIRVLLFGLVQNC